MEYAGLRLNVTDDKNDVDATLIVDGQALGCFMKAHKLPVCTQSFEVKAKGQTKSLWGLSQSQAKTPVVRYLAAV